MPTYDYEHNAETTKCSRGRVFEVFESITTQPMKKCPDCNESIHRLIGAGAGLIFKGTGFYQTDYKGSKPPEKPAVETKPTEHKSADPAKATEPKTYKKD